MDIQFMKDYYDLRYEETDGENHFVEETAYQEKQSEQSKMEDQLMEMVGGSESNVWKLYESIMCVYSPYFLYYWLSTKKEYLFSISSVTRTPILSKGVFEEIEIPSISRSEQDKIAKVLLVLDKKIKLNSEVNDNLAA